MTTPLRVLIVEDSVDDTALLVRELIRAGYDVTYERVETAPGLSAALTQGKWDLVFGDYTMPGFSGTAALRMVREQGLDVPFIFVSGTIGEDLAVEAMKAGADDYVIKNNLKRLLPAVARELRDAEVRRERARLEVALRHAQRLESVGRLAGGVAHDFNNLLTVITGHIGLLLMDPQLTEAYRDDLAEIKRAAERATDLTRQLLAFSRQQILDLRVLNPNAVVTDVMPMLRRVIGEDIKLVTDLDPALVSVKADFGQLQQVLVNLAVNARDAMPAGGTLTIETANTTLEEESEGVGADVAPGPYATLAVSDTGAGMDAETVARIFEPFFTTKETGKGTGLGLATTYGIVSQSGGRIRVESEPGSGTTFTILLPATDESPTSAPAADQGTALPTGTEVVLVVEDEPAVRKLTERMLRRQGYDVIAVAQAEDALDRLREEDRQVDLLLTDVVLPGMSGRDLAIRAEQTRRGIKILYASGYSREGILEPGAALLRKPFTAEELIRKVREILDA